MPNIRIFLIKVLLIFLSLCCLFLLSRLHDVQLWVQSHFQEPASVETSSLPVKVLKQLLEQRCQAYDNSILEKSELCKLVQQSGEVTQEELYALQQPNETMTGDALFTSREQFYRIARLSKEPWLLMVDGEDKVSSGKFWQDLRHCVNVLSIHTGVLDCTLDQVKCSRDERKSPRLHLVVPGAGSEAHNIRTYSGKYSQERVYRWVLEILHNNLVKVFSPAYLVKTWLTFHHPLQQPAMRVVILTDKRRLPPFMLVLAAQYKGPVKFIWAVVNPKSHLAHWTQSLNVGAEGLTLPLVLAANSEGVYVYGQQADECFSSSCLQTFLDFFYPNQNTALNVSIVLAILLALLEAVLLKNDVVQRVLWRLVLYNIFTVVFWLIYSAYDSVYVLRLLNTALARLCRSVAITRFGGIIRHDVIFFTHHWVTLLLSLLPTFFFMKTLASKFFSKYLDKIEGEDEEK